MVNARKGVFIECPRRAKEGMREGFPQLIPKRAQRRVEVETREIIGDSGCLEWSGSQI